MVADDRLYQGILHLQEIELQQQAFAQVAGGHADRIERLHRANGLLHFSRLVAAGGHDLFVRGPQIAVLVDVADDELADLFDARRGVAHHELPGEVIGEIGWPGEGVLDRELFVLLGHPGVVAVLDVVLKVGVVVDLVKGVLVFFLLRLGCFGLFFGLSLVLCFRLSLVGLRFFGRLFQ